MSNLLALYEIYFGKPDKLVELSPVKDISILLAIQLPKEGKPGHIVTLGLSALIEDHSTEFLIEIEEVPSEEVLKRMGAFLYEFYTGTYTDDNFGEGHLFRDSSIPGFERMNTFMRSYTSYRYDLWLDDGGSKGNVVRLTPLFEEEANEVEKITEFGRDVLMFRSGIKFGNPHREKTDIVYTALYNVWTSIAEWYTENGVNGANILNAELAKEKTSVPGEELEKQLGFPIPEDFKQSFNIVNRHVRVGIYYLAELNDLVRRTHSLGEMAASGEFDEALEKLEPHYALRPVWWHKNWIPIGHDSLGESLIIDMAPAEGGNDGQVIYHEKVMGPRVSKNCCFLEWLHFYHDALKTGEYVVDEDGVLGIY